MIRLVVVDVVLLALEAAYVAWVSRDNCGSPINFFSGRSLPARDRWVGTAVAVAVVVGLVFGTAAYSAGTRAVNFLVFLVVVTAVVVGVQLVHNRAVDRR